MNREAVKNRRAQVKQLAAGGLSTSEIAVRLGLEYHTVHNDLRLMELAEKRREEAAQKVSERRQRVKQLYVNQGLSGLKIAAILNIGGTTVQADLLALGIKPRPHGNQWVKKETCKNGHALTPGARMPSGGCRKCSRMFARRKLGLDPNDPRNLRSVGLVRRRPLPPTFPCGHPRTAENSYKVKREGKTGTGVYPACKRCILDLGAEKRNGLDKQMARVARDIKNAIKEADEEDWEKIRKELRAMRRQQRQVPPPGSKEELNGPAQDQSPGATEHGVQRP